MDARRMRMLPALALVGVTMVAVPRATSQPVCESPRTVLSLDSRVGTMDLQGAREPTGFGDLELEPTVSGRTVHDWSGLTPEARSMDVDLTPEGVRSLAHSTTPRRAVSCAILGMAMGAAAGFLVGHVASNGDDDGIPEVYGLMVGAGVGTLVGLITGLTDRPCHEPVGDERTDR